MTAEEDLVTQAAIFKAANPLQRVWVYRNIVKALPFFSSVQEKINDAAYSDWFLDFAPGGGGVPHVPTCDNNTGLCSNKYHDQEQTPGYPSGDGNCSAPGCDCGGVVPCGEYLWNWANSSLLDFIVNDFLLGPTGVGNENITGLYLDDNIKNYTNPSKGCKGDACDCDHGPFGGFTEINYYCTEDMGLITQESMNVIYDFMQDLATFLLIRGPYAFFGAGWSGCNVFPSYPEFLDTDFGVPLTPYYNETVPMKSGVFIRQWSKATVQFDCNKYEGSIILLL